MTEAEDPRTSLNADEEEAPIHSNRSAIVVGRSAALDNLVEHVLPQSGFAGPIHRVEGYLFAMGQISEVGVPALIIGGIDALDGSAAPVATALRRLAPQARLLLVVAPNEKHNAIELVRAGFDAYLVEPVDPASLQRAVGVALTNQPGDGRHVDSDKTLPESISEEVRLRLLTEADVSSSKLVERSHRNGNQLGDVDLIEQLLHDRRHMRDMALQIMTTRSEMNEVGLAKNASDVPSGHRSTNVAFEGKTYGRLHALPSATDEQLSGWAQWLARWVALDARMARVAEMAVRDELTGLWNRRYFNYFLETILQKASRDRFHVTLMVFDLDHRASFSSRYGQLVGDQILFETGRLLQSYVRAYDVVARIGDAQFAIIIWEGEAPRRINSQHPNNIVSATERFRRAIEQQRDSPKLIDKDLGTLKIWGGLAGFPWHGRTSQELLEQASRMVRESRESGNRAFTYGAEAKPQLV